MPKMDPRKGWAPKLHRHKASGLGRVKIGNFTKTFGRWPIECGDTPPPEVQQKYDEWKKTWIASGFQESAADKRGATIHELVDAFKAWAETPAGYKQPNKPNSELYCVRSACRLLRAHFGEVEADRFTADHLRRLREIFVRHRDAKGKPWSRDYVNEQVNRVRRVFSWGVWNGNMVQPATVLHLRELPGFRKKRTDAPESPKRKKPVDQAVIEQTLEKMETRWPSVWRMIQVHRLVGCRASEICTLRPCDIDKDAAPDCWKWTPMEFKQEGQDVEVYYWFGPKAQTLLAPALEGKAPTDWVFPTLRKRGEGRYRKDSYNRAIARVCERFGLPKWSAGRLRHTCATAVKQHENTAGRNGTEGAQAVLCQAEPGVTERYAKRDAVARRIMAEIG